MSIYVKSEGWTVYVHTSPNKKVYVGITSRPPTQRWRNGTGYKNNSYFHNSIIKYGWNNFSHEIICSNVDENHAKKLEVELIKKYQSNIRLFGYNMTLGGDGTLGRTCSDETKRKISNAHKGKIYTEERKDKQRIAITGKKHSEETKDKIRQGNIGNNNGRRVRVICTTTNEIFDSAEDGAKKYKTFRGGIIRVCKHKQLSSGKLNGVSLRWEYYKEEN